jgi:hypothetical protein
MYYAGLRPEEAINLSRDNVILPPRDRGDDDWGELRIRSATPDAGGEWTDDGSVREMRQLKHRAEGDSRVVPTHPELTRSHAVTCGFGEWEEWGGWDSNPGPADYESSRPAAVVRVTDLRRHGVPRS